MMILAAKLLAILLANGLLIAISIAGHELAHVLAARGLGVQASWDEPMAAGAAISSTRQARWIAGAGPAFNIVILLLIAAALVMVIIVAPGWTGWGVAAVALPAVVNLAAAANLRPSVRLGCMSDGMWVFHPDAAFRIAPRVYRQGTRPEAGVTFGGGDA